MKAPLILTIAAVLGALAVLLGAFGAHGLAKVLAEPQLQTYHTATDYLLYHALALLGIAALKLQKPQISGISVAAMLMLSGIILFSGSLYLYLLTGISGLVWLTPVGGSLLVIAWLVLAWQGIALSRQQK